MHRFTFESEVLGGILAHSFSVSAMSKAQKWLKGKEGFEPEDFARMLTELICQIDAQGDSAPSEKRLSNSESSKLTKNDLEKFAELFIQNNPHFTEDIEKEKSVRSTNEKGETVVSIEKFQSEELQKKESESNCQHLLRILPEHIKQSTERTKKLFGGTLGKYIFSNTTMDLLNENKRISSMLGETLHNYEPIKFPELPENPVFETNRTLKTLGSELSEVGALIKNMNDLAVQITVDSTRASLRTKIWNNIMFSLGLLTLIITATISYKSYVSANNSTETLAAVMKKTNLNIEQLISVDNKIISNSIKLNELIETNVMKTEETNTKLTELLEVQKKYNKLINRTVNTSVQN